jgi:hypothetical protein
MSLNVLFEAPQSERCLNVLLSLLLHSILQVNKRTQLKFSGMKVRLVLDVAANFKKEPARGES